MKIEENDYLLINQRGIEKAVKVTKANKHQNRFLYQDKKGETGFKRSAETVIKKITEKEFNEHKPKAID